MFGYGVGELPRALRFDSNPIRKDSLPSDPFTLGEFVKNVISGGSTGVFPHWLGLGAAAQARAFGISGRERG